MSLVTWFRSLRIAPHQCHQRELPTPAAANPWQFRRTLHRRRKRSPTQLCYGCAIEALEPRQLLTAGPAIAEVLMSSSDWSASFLEAFENAGVGTGGYRLPAIANEPIRPLPWIGLDQIHVRFDRDVIMGQDDLELRGVNVPSYPISEFDYDSASRTASWRLATSIDEDRLAIVLFDDITDVSGNALDGEWSLDQDQYPSGDGEAGGAFFYRFDVLPGDFNQDGQVTRRDFANKLPHTFVVAEDASFSTLADTNGDGVSNVVDWVIGRNRMASILPVDDALKPTRVIEISPTDGEELVNTVRKTIVRFSAAVDPTTVTADAFHLIAQGESVPGRIRVSATERFATYFYDDPLPASTAVRVVVDGDLILTREGLRLDADGDGVPGGVTVAEFHTLPLTRIPGTTVWGYVYDSYNKNQDGTDIPVVGATIRVDAFPDANVVTDANGRFELGIQDVNADGVPDGLPAPEFFVHVDGTTAASAPAGTVYPSVGKPFHSVPGQSTQLNMQGTPFNVYLPPMAMADIVPLSATQDTPVGFGAAAMTELTNMFPGVDPAVWGQMQVVYPVGSAVDDQGNAATTAIVIPVPPDRIPAPLPAGLEPELVISIQAPGATSFDTPAPITFPNLENLPPGEKASVLSFNHDAGRWDFIGLGTVSADGAVVVSDPGVGIVAPGWHFVGPPPFNPPPPPPPPPPPACPPNPSPGASPICADSPPATQTQPIPASAPQPCRECRDPDAAAAEEAKCKAEANKRYEERAAIAAATLSGAMAGCVFLVEAPPAAAGCLIGVIATYLAAIYEVQNQFKDDLDDCEQENPCFVPPGGSPEASASFVAAAPEAEDPIIAQLTADVERIATLLQPYSSDPDSFPQTVVDEIKSIVTATNVLAGGDAAAHARQVALQIEQASLGNGLGKQSQQPDYPVLYVAKMLRENGETFEVRGQTRPGGQYTLFVPAGGTLQKVSFFDPRTNSFGVTYPYLRSGLPYQMPHPNFFPLADDAPDADSDGLYDGVESVYGTNPNSADTDGDGINDRAEIQQGLDPLGGRAFPTGIIASLPLRGEAKEVVVEGSTLDSQRQTAYVATGSYGLAIVDASRFNNPIVLGQLDLPGDAVDVAVDTRLGIAAIAAGTAGLHLVDVSDPMQPALIQTIPGIAQQVQVSQGVAYVARGDELRTYDLVSGQLQFHRSYPGGTIAELTSADGFLYFVSTVIQLHRVTKVQRRFELADPVASILINATPVLALPHVAAGGGFVYVGGVDVSMSNQVPGIEILRDDGDHFTATGPRSAITAVEVALNGSGLALFGGGNSTGGLLAADVGLLDVSDPTQTDRLLTVIPTPGGVSSIAIGSGIAYVADREAGLQVINYLPFDGNGVAPSISVSSASDVDPIVPGNQVIEGSDVSLNLAITDDVQVRNVQLLVDGNVVRNDVSFPFDLTFPAPNISGQSATSNAMVRVFDTGGNRAEASIAFELLPDVVAPQIVHITPVDGARREPSFRTIQIGFSKPMNAASLTADAIRLTSTAAPNVPVVPLAVQASDNDEWVVVAYDALQLGDYEIFIDAPAITDRAGNRLGETPIVSSFSIVTADVYWTNPDGGFWDDAANWSTGEVPGPNESVQIGVPGGATITHRTGDSAIRSLAANNPLVLSGGTLSVAESSVIADTLDLSGTLSGEGDVTIVGTLNWSGGKMTGSGRTVIAPGATANLSGSSTITLARPLENAGTVNYSGPGLQFGDATAGEVVFSNFPGGAFNVIGDGDFQQATLAAHVFNNAGILNKVSGSGVANFDVILNNSGTINTTQGEFRFSRGGNQDGTVDVSAGSAVGFSSELTFTERSRLTGSGTIRFASGIHTLAGEINVTGQVVVSGTAVFDAPFSLPTLTLAGGTISGSADLSITGTFEWSTGNMTGTGRTILTQGGVANITGPQGRNLARSFDNFGTVNYTGSGLLVGSSASPTDAVEIFNHVGGVINVTASADFNRASNAAHFVQNEGTFHKSGAGTFTVVGVPVNNTGTIRVSGGSLFLEHPLDNSGTIDVSAGSVLFVTGTFQQTALATIRTELGGLSNNQVGRLTVFGAAMLDGVFETRLTNEFTPGVGNVFSVLTYNSRSGQFATIDGNGIQYNPIYGPTGLSLTVASLPEPVPAPAAAKAIVTARGREVSIRAVPASVVDHIFREASIPTNVERGERVLRARRTGRGFVREVFPPGENDSNEYEMPAWPTLHRGRRAIASHRS